MGGPPASAAVRALCCAGLVLVLASCAGTAAEVSGVGTTPAATTSSVGARPNAAASATVAVSATATATATAIATATATTSATGSGCSQAEIDYFAGAPGEATPERALAAGGRRGEGWTVISRTASRVTFGRGPESVEVRRQPEGGWLVDTVTTCR